MSDYLQRIKGFRLYFGNRHGWVTTELGKVAQDEPLPRFRWVSLWIDSTPLTAHHYEFFQHHSWISCLRLCNRVTDASTLKNN